MRPPSPSAVPSDPAVPPGAAVASDPAGPPPPARWRPPSAGVRSPARRRLVGMLAVLAFLALPAVAGYEVGRVRDDARPVSNAIAPGVTPAPLDAGGAFDPDAVAAAVGDAVVNVTTRVEGGGVAAGSGIVISERGLVLTNNHVISGTTSLQVEFGASGVTRPAEVLGYSVVDDVALLRVRNVSNLPRALLGNSTSLAIGDPIVAIGNGGGDGGSPKVVSGTVTALEQEITAANPDGTNAQTLDGLIEIAAAIQSGDSGGPVVDRSGTVVGMSVAASVRNGFSAGRAQGYAIPIEDAVAIAERIESGDGGVDIRVGATRGVLGVQIQPDLAGGRGQGGAGGAQVVGVEEGSGADRAGLAEGDVITALDDRPVTSSGDLIRGLVAYGPGDRVEVTWRDGSGRTQRATLELAEGPPA